MINTFPVLAENEKKNGKREIVRANGEENFCQLQT